MSLVEREIRQQPDVLARLLREGRDIVLAAADRIRARSPRFVFVAARGSSDNAARYAQYLFGAVNRLPVALAAPSLFTLYQRPPALRDCLTIGISQSGRSPDIVAVLAAARQQGALTLALTNDPTSPLAQTAELVVPLLAGEEQAVAATKTYTAQLFALAMLSAALAGEPARWAELAALPDAVRACLDDSPGSLTLPATFRQPYLAVIGRGFNYATAFEIALKVKELCLVVAEPYSSADFRHGPIALVEPGFPVVVVAIRGAVFADVAALVALLHERKAALAVISDDPSVLDDAQLPLRVPRHVPEWLSPIVAVVPGQRFAVALARQRGLDPDRPRGLEKVTRTF